MTNFTRRYGSLLRNGSIALLLCVLALAFVAGSVRAEATKVFVFGNSLINHVSGTEKTTVPHWLAHLADRNGEELELDGKFGFLRNFASELPPQAQWSFENVTPAWGRSYRQFDDVGYSHYIFNPANFIQYQAADEAYHGDNPEGFSPLSAAAQLFQNIAPSREIILYEGWADLEAFSTRFPPRNRPLRKYHAYNQGDYHDWYVDFANKLQAALPERNVTLIPIARILSRAFTETGLKGLKATDIYLDTAPHGAPNLYFLASIPVYARLFGSLPDVDDVPAEVHPLIKAHFSDYLKIIAEEMPIQKAEVSVDAPSSGVSETSNEVPQVDRAASDAPALGYGLDGIADWSTQVPFVDLMKSSRQWVGHLKDAEWGGWGQAELEDGGYLDAEGWPVKIPERLTKIETFMLTDFPEDARQHNGLYRLSWEGEGKIDLSGSSRATRYGDHEIWFRFSVGGGPLGIVIYNTDPNGTGDNIRNISIVREDQIPLFEAGVVFNPEWLRVVEDVRLVRFMDWMFTNGSDLERWADRPVISDYSYTRRGVPVELMVELVNQIGADPWFTMPHKADDDFMRRFAAYVQSHLRAGLKAHVEYSNEVWNFLFPQTHWAAAEAEKLWGADTGGDAWMQFYGHRSAQMAQIWSEIFAQDMDRLTRVLATHTGWPGLEQGALNAPLAVQQGAPKPVEYFDAYAVTGYFGLEYGSDEKAPVVVKWIAESQAAGLGYQTAIENVARDLQSNGLKQLTEELWPHHANVAKKHGLDLIMYEGGTHVVGHLDWTENEELTAFFHALNYSPEMAEIYHALLSAWEANGGTVFNAFVDVSKPSKWGSWGTRRHLNDGNPRLQALSDYNLAGASWDIARSAEDFAAGVVITGGAGTDVLAGTEFSDVLIGQAGDDEFSAGKGNNYVHGGEGNDHVVLQGFLEEYRFGQDGEKLVAKSKHGTTRLFAVETLSFSETPDLILSASDLF